MNSSSLQFLPLFQVFVSSLSCYPKNIALLELLLTGEDLSRYVNVNKTDSVETRVSAAADRPAQSRGSAHANIPYRVIWQSTPFLLLGLAAEYRSRRWV